MKLCGSLRPGTITAAEALDARGNNFLMAVCQDNQNFGLAVTDITTGEFRCTEFAEEQSFLDEIGRIAPSEIIAPQNGAGLLRLLRKEFSTLHITAAPENFFSGEAARKLMTGEDPRKSQAPGIRVSLRLRGSSTIWKPMSANILK